MAEYKRDLWGKGYLDVTEDIRQVRRDEKFRHDMGRIGQNFDNDMAAGLRNGVMGAAALGGGAVAVGVAATKNLRSRYKLQALLHFPFAFIVSGMIFVGIATWLVSNPVVHSAEAMSAYDERLAADMLIALAIAVPVSIIWSIIYIHLRTKPKLRRLGY